MLRVYDSAEVVQAIAENPDTAPIPDLHKLVFRWTGKFVTRPWELDAGDIAELRGSGLSDREITQWAVRASSQSWFTMCADGAGVDLDGGMPAGPAVGRERSVYESECRPAGSKPTPAPVQGSAERRSDVAWVETDETSEAFKPVAAAAVQRWGHVPVLLRAISTLPEVLDTYFYMLELLERPQSDGLAPRTHALVRAQVARTNRTSWSSHAIGGLLARHGSTPDGFDQQATELAHKLVTTPWKVTDKDAASFRAQGYDDEVYLDVLNTTAIQNALDRLSWALGVPDDPMS